MNPWPWPPAQQFARGVVALLVLLCGLAWLHPAQAKPAEEVVRMGFYVKITRDLSRAEVQTALEFWARELSAKFNIDTRVRFYDDMGALRRDFDRGQVNFVITSSMDFVRYFRLDELADGFVGALQVDHSLMLATRTGGDALGLEQMAGKRIALLKDDELSEIFLETLCMRHYRRTCKEVFASMEQVDNSNKLVMRLFFGKTDLILARKNGLELAKEMNPQIGEAIRVVHNFPVKSSYYGFFNSAVDKPFRDRALRQIPTMHLEPRGRQVLEVFKLERLERAQASDLQPLILLNQEYEALLAELKKGGRAR